EPTPVEGTGRLGRGALGTLVRDYLAARPGEASGPTAVGKALGRSQGAISNALSACQRSSNSLAGRHGVQVIPYPGVQVIPHLPG
ncbi:MAG TPA: hypothetical protein VNF71_06570, partial [Acidimicrobiales bacterium]|nr:hypothetical protein [Acidimicrobiales bacterium]